MRLRIFALTFPLALFAFGCAKEDANSTDTAPQMRLDAGADSGAASNSQLTGGTLAVSQANLELIQNSACAGPVVRDAGFEDSAALDAGTCAYAIPRPAPGLVVDPYKTVVLLLPPSGEMLIVGPSASSCAYGDGWYFGDAQTIVLCPKTCEMTTAAPAAGVRIFVGCVHVGCSLC